MLLLVMIHVPCDIVIGKEKLSKTVSDQNWDLIKIVCTQPFNKVIVITTGVI